MNRIVMERHELDDLQKRLLAEKVYFMAGSNSIYIPAGRQKVMDVSVCREWPDLDGEFVMMTPGEAARTELKRHYPDHKKCGWVRGHTKLFDWTSPWYARITPYQNLIQIDLSGAYHQIYKWLYVDQPFGGFGSKPLFPVAMALSRWKTARNSVIGIAHARKSTAFKEGKRIQISAENPWLNPALWATVQAVLHEVAVEAIKWGAVYVATDSYTFKANDYGIDGMVEYLQANSFEWRVNREGAGEISGWTNYQIGDFQTHLHKLKSEVRNEIDNVRHDTAGRFTGLLRRSRERLSAIYDLEAPANDAAIDRNFARNLGTTKDSPKNYMGRQLGIFDTE